MADYPPGNDPTYPTLRTGKGTSSHSKLPFVEGTWFVLSGIYTTLNSSTWKPDLGFSMIFPEKPTSLRFFLGLRKSHWFVLQDSWGVLFFFDSWWGWSSVLSDSGSIQDERMSIRISNGYCLMLDMDQPNRTAITGIRAVFPRTAKQKIDHKLTNRWLRPCIENDVTRKREV